MENNTRFNSINSYLRKVFGRKTVKLSIDGGFTCPNRDGTLGTGGCAFCSPDGSGEMASDIDGQIELLSKKWPDAAYIGYFQSHTNTYEPVEDLRRKYYSVLQDPRISGIAIATRPDCLSDEVLDLLSEINQKHFMWVELGLQTSNPETMKKMNLGYTTEDFRRSVKELNRRNIKVVTHLILGLPGESEEDMFNSVKFLTSGENGHIFGLKLHLLNVVKGSTLAATMPDYTPFSSIEEYCDLVVRILEIIPPDITIHRLTGDAPRSLLITPEWRYRKRTILNTINKMMNERDAKQGDKILK